MAAFNSMPPMSSGLPSDAMDHHMNHQQQGQPELDLQHFNTQIFDDALLDGLPHGLPFTPSYDFNDFANTFEDPFSYSTRTFEPPPPTHHHQDVLNDESSPQELDNKLLGFSDPTLTATVVDDMGKMGDLNMTAELYGMFFVAEDVFGAENTGRPLELTCYRRNLWQCSGQITLPRIISHIVDDKGRQVPLTDLSATITAVESIEGKSTEIISIPWKSSNPQATEESKVAGPPPSISLDLASGQELDAKRISLPVSWKRLQFKHATANNGRRKGLQQHYVVQISLLGNTKSGESIKVAEIQSGPVIVRGRSPRNFDSRKDVPLSGDKRLERRNTATSADVNIKSERDAFQAHVQKQPLGMLSQGNEWANAQPFAQLSQSPHPAKRLAMSPTMAKPPVPGWSNNATNKSLNPAQMAKSVPRNNSTTAPINLSLSEDERSPNRSSAEISSPQMGKAYAASGLVAGSSPPEEEDPLYEYFPLSVDDWMPPVDAVYRPHVVHHTIVPPEIKAQQVSTKAKRYFAAE